MWPGEQPPVVEYTPHRCTSRSRSIWVSAHRLLQSTTRRVLRCTPVHEDTVWQYGAGCSAAFQERQGPGDRDHRGPGATIPKPKGCASLPSQTDGFWPVAICICHPGTRIPKLTHRYQFRGLGVGVWGRGGLKAVQLQVQVQVGNGHGQRCTSATSEALPSYNEQNSRINCGESRFWQLMGRIEGKDL